jgi:hypothetical protein
MNASPSKFKNTFECKTLLDIIKQKYGIRGKYILPAYSGEAGHPFRF